MTDLNKTVADLKRAFEDHRHTGTDSLQIESTIVSQGSLTASDSATVDATYGTEEAGVINNLRTRQIEIETALIALGLLE